MKWISLALAMVLLSGCGVHNNQLDQAMELRASLLAAQECCFQAVVTADYSDKTYSFTVDYRSDSQGNVSFTVKEPETIEGITGTISAEGGKLTFDDKALAFELLADGQVTPVSAGYLLIKSLRSGYIRGCGSDGDQTELLIDDSYQENAMRLEICLDGQNVPVSAQIIYKDRRFLSMDIKNFRIL